MNGEKNRYIPSWCIKDQYSLRPRYRLTDRRNENFVFKLIPLTRDNDNLPFLLEQRTLSHPFPDISFENEELTASPSKDNGAGDGLSYVSGLSTPETERSSENKRTSREIVDLDNLIANLNSSSGYEFFYLTPLTTLGTTPYTYKFSTAHESGRFYLTVSPKGVITHNGCSQYFTPLNTWTRDYELYKSLIVINFFRTFGICKAFSIWRRSISYRKMISARKCIEKNLYMLNINLRCIHFKIISQFLKMNRTSFPELSKIENLELNDFLRLQTDKLNLVFDNLLDFHKTIVSYIYHACEQELEKQETSRLWTKRRAVSARDTPKMTFCYLEQCNRKRLCMKLSRYIYLIGFMVNEIYCKILRKSFIAVCNSFCRYNESLSSDESDCKQVEDDLRRRSFAPKSPFFQIKLKSDGRSFTLIPSPEQFTHSIRTLLSQWTTAILDLPKIVSDEKLSLFTRPIINGKMVEVIYSAGPSIQFAIDKDDVIKNTSDKIISLFTDNFQSINNYLDTLLPIHQFHVENKKAQIEDVTSETDPTALRELLEKFNFQIKAVNSIGDKECIGFFLLKLDEFKAEVLPLSTEMLRAVEQTIPVFGSKKIQQLSKECIEAMSTLEREPKNTLDVVAYLDFMVALSQRFKVIDEQVEYVDQIYAIVTDFNVPCGNDDLDAHMNLKSQLSLLKSLCNKMLDEKEDIIAKLNRHIEKDIAHLTSEILAISDEAKQDWLTSKHSNADECIMTLHLLSERLLSCQKRATEIRSHQKKFQLPLANFVELDVSMSELKIRQLLWETFEACNKALKEYRFGDFNSFNPDTVVKFVNKTLKSVNQIDKYLGENEITSILKEELSHFQVRIPILVHLRNPALKSRHWLQVEQLLKKRFVPEEPFNLDTLEACSVLDYVKELEELAAQASSEAALESLLKKVHSEWENLELTVVKYRDSNDSFILGGLDEIQKVLDDSLININTILSSKHVGPIKSRVQAWHSSLNLFSKTLDEWSACQVNWLYLEAIFSTPDIQSQLPVEARLFQIVDRSWKDIMRKTRDNPLALQAATAPGILESLENNNKLIDQILKCLEAYLESKRVVFPRFYFLSNEELLEILAQTRNPLAVQPHLGKCFDGIKELEFAIIEGSAAADITAMISPEGEKVPLCKAIKARGNVEDWLLKVEDTMFLTLKEQMKDALTQHSKMSRQNWIFNHPAQIILAVSQILRCASVHAIYEESSGDRLDNLKEFEKENINNLTELAEMVQSDLLPLNRSIICALITIDVHARDSLSSLIAKKVICSDDFEWLKCLRYYWLPSIEECAVKMSSSCMTYGYEYLGASTRLVLTPLTDKCYLCLMGAVQLHLGGATAGPAGTGKTETTKDLAKALAVHCVVFNCSESLDYKMMGKFFSGLAQAGSWCCFDEFNRIEVEVLSVIAQQLLTIRNAKVAKLARFMFEGRELKLNMRCSVFITMNPGYAGRTELPDNLKALFRPMAMMIPDYALIAEVILYSEGFTNSKALSYKTTLMFKLCSEQLSQQRHYDFGMRALKSVLAMAGRLKRTNPDVVEDLVIIRAMKDSNEPKFIADDILLFQGIITDLFPSTNLPSHAYGVLDKAVRNQLVEDKLQPEANLVQKVMQLYETMAVRHGVMLVGPAGCGKSTVLNTLKSVLTQLHRDGVEHPDYLPVRTFIMNPKCISIGELYGEVDPITLEWRDGVLGMAVRNAVQCEDLVHCWIVCDGPVDAVWIENLNTVLDDNKILCLANSERIRLKDRICLVFETENLDQASPATVSRCGMIYMDTNELQWLPYVKSWLAHSVPNTHLTDKQKVFLLTLFETHVPQCLQYVSKNCLFVIQQVNLGKIAALCNLLQALIQGFLAKEPRKEMSSSILCHLFAFALLWAVGGNIDGETKQTFQHFLKMTFKNNADTSFDESLNLWNVFVDETGKFSPWTSLLPQFIYDPDTPFFDILVPTVDTVRYSSLMTKFISVGRGVSFVGKTGVGKSVLAKSVLSTLKDLDEHVPLKLCFSAQTSSHRTQQIIEAPLEKKRKNLLGAPFGKKVVVFVDDVNMPAPDLYGSQPPIELLRQYLDFGGFYDREKLFWKDVEDVIFCSACCPPGGGRNEMSQRFVRHFAILAIETAPDETISTIFTSILKGFFAEFNLSIQKLTDSIVNCAISLFRQVEKNFLPTPSKSHYTFNIRDLSKCIQGIMQANSGEVTEPVTILRLFYHECIRSFQDRLICYDDKFTFAMLLKNLCNECFGSPVVDFNDDTTTLPILIFGDFMPNALNEKVYKEITSMATLKKILQEVMSDYNSTSNQSIELVLFDDALEHCCRIARILRAERGNGFLVGVAGMGKQSLTKLACHLNGHRCFQISISQKYDMVAFQSDLRTLYCSAGFEDTPCTFMLTDNQIVMEEFLENISNILDSGEVPNLFDGEELDKVIHQMRAIATDMNSDVSREEIFQKFLSKAMKQIHIIISMSPVGDSFRRRCRMFPSLVNNCTIDWFLTWPAEALLSVANDLLRDTVNDALSAKLNPICVSIHEASEAMCVRLLKEKNRHFYCTPSSYLQLLTGFKKMLTFKSEKVNSLRDKFSNGLQKLYETNAVVETMKTELVAYEPLLLKKSQTTSDLMKHLAKEQAAADHVRQVVVSDEAVAKAKATETQLIADDAQKDLASALPAMESAMKSLDALNKTDIGELKVFNKPPNLVKVVMEAVCLLFGIKQDWGSAKVLLGDVNFLKRLREFDKDHMSESMLKILRAKYIDHPDFVPDKVAAQSKVCRSLCMWVRALDVYAKVYKIVEPKRRALEVAEAELATIMGILREKQKKLAEVEGQIAGLEADLDAAVAEKQTLEDAMSLTVVRLNRSSRLTTALGDEQTRWEDQVQMYTKKLQNLIGDSLLSASCLAYIGPFPNDLRKELIEIWLKSCLFHGVTVSKDFSIMAAMTDPYEIRSWVACGLPQDDVSAENAVLVTRAGRWPLLVDPQGQGNLWVRGLEGPNGLRVVRCGDASFHNTITACIRTGSPVLIEDVTENVDPSLLPLLRNQTFIKAGVTMIQFSDSEIEYDKNFKLYLSSKLANPHFLPEICIVVSVVNFSISINGIEEQLLSEVVRLEKPDLENTRNELVTRINSDKLQLKAIEDKILTLLFRATGNILDDEELIDTLNESRETTEITAARLEEAEITETRICTARDRYRPVAARGAILHSTVMQLSSLDTMYQYSQTYLTQIFSGVVSMTEQSAVVEERVSQLITDTTLATFNNIARSLFERHKLVFAFMLCIAIKRHADLVANPMYLFFLRGPGPNVPTISQDNPYKNISDSAWISINVLSQTFARFQNLPLTMSNLNLSIGELNFKYCVTADQPDINWNQCLDDFEKLILIKILSVENLIAAILEYIKIHLGPKFVETPSVSLSHVYQDTSNLTPLIFIVSPGSDPSSALLKFASERGLSGTLQTVSLGQGQGPIAEKMLASASQRGDWLFLQNCHLALSWMSHLETKYMALVDGSDKVHSDFRLFFSCLPFDGFPVSILQNAVKVTNEPPRGIRANMLRSLSQMSKDYFEDSPLQKKWRRMVFGLCFFHAFVQERKNYGPLGFNIPYEFNDSDLDMALNNLRSQCIDFNIPWDALQYVSCEIIYGGRVTDQWDLRCLRTALLRFFSPKALEADYTYSASGRYYCPESADHSTMTAYLQYVKDWPIDEDAEIFGLSENANISYKTLLATNLLSTILDLEQNDNQLTPKGADELVINLANSIESKLAVKLDMEYLSSVITKTDSKNRISPMSTVLFQEVARFNKLLDVVKTSVKDLKKAIAGEVVMSQTLENIYTSFQDSKVPKAWTMAAYPSLQSLGSWVENLILRTKFIQDWLRNGPPPSFWISGFFFPQGFLTAALQMHSRRSEAPIDQLQFDFKLLNSFIHQEDSKNLETTDKPDEGVYVHGLYLEAGHWDLLTGCLVDSLAGQSHSFLPILWLLPKQVPLYQNCSTEYECPMYKTGSRSGAGTSNNFVLCVALPSNHEPSHWILRGTALLMETPNPN